MSSEQQEPLTKQQQQQQEEGEGAGGGGGGGQQKQGEELIHPTMVSFMYGQFANLFKFAFWWVALSPLLYSICNGSTAIGVGRIVYNSALCLASPFGPLIIEHYSPRNILLSAAGVRFIVWCILLPLNWILFDTDIANSPSQLGVYAMMVLMLLLDGASVGLSSVLDIDMMGVDIFAGYLGHEVTEEHRNAFNSRQELFFSMCFIIFAPGMAFLGLALKQAFSSWQEKSIAHNNTVNLSFEQVESGTLSGMFIITFLIATILQFAYFWGLKRADEGEEENGGGVEGERQNRLGSGGEEDGEVTNHSMSTKNNNRLSDGSGEEDVVGSMDQIQQGESSSSSAGSSGEQQQKQGEGGEQQQPEEELTTCGKVSAVFTDLKESFFLVISHRAILFRLIFFGFELAFEDASIVVLAAQLGIRVPWMGNKDSVRGAIWTSVIVAVGKLGAAIASYIMMRYYHPPEDIMGHTKLFLCIGLSTLVIVPIPLAFDGYSSGNLAEDSARAIVFLSFLFYFFLSTLPKLGLMSLLQTMVSQVENGHRAFAFIAILATTIDSVVIMILSVLFADADNESDKHFSNSLWVTTYIFLAHGLLETVFGPILILRPATEEQKKIEEGAGGAGSDETQKLQDNNSNNNEEGGYGTLNKSQKGDDVRSKKVPSSLAAQPPSPMSTSPVNIQDGTGGLDESNLDRTYSARGVGVPIPIRPTSAAASGGGAGTSSLQRPGGSLLYRSALSGMTPRGASRMTPRGGGSHSNLASSSLGGGGGGIGGTSLGGSFMRQHNMLGSGTGPGAIAASMNLVNTNPSSPTSQQQQQVGSHSPKSPSRLGQQGGGGEQGNEGGEVGYVRKFSQRNMSNLDDRK